MNRIITVNLPSFISYVRESQGITQKELAEKIGITQSAITQYENSAAVLSREKLRAMAPHLNLNPEFVDLGNGNPFKQANPRKIISMFFHQTRAGEIDYSAILEQILQYNDLAVILFLKPSGSADNSLRARRWQAKGLSSCALVIQDGDGNGFVFKRKDGAFFNEQDLLLLMEQQEAVRPKSFDVHHVMLQADLYEDIKKWTLSKQQIESLLAAYKANDSRIFLLELLRRSRAFRRPSDNPDQDRLNALNLFDTIEHLGPAHAEKYLTALMPDIYDLLIKHFLPNRG